MPGVERGGNKSLHMYWYNNWTMVMFHFNLVKTIQYSFQASSVNFGLVFSNRCSDKEINFVLQNQTDDGIRKEMIALHEDKHNYETTAKESLRRVLQEKIEVVRKLSEVEVIAQYNRGSLCASVYQHFIYRNGTQCTEPYSMSSPNPPSNHYVLSK